jgi:hypothetical protein
MTEVGEPQSGRELLAELAGLLKCRTSSGLIAGCRGRVVMTAGGLLVEPGPSAPLWVVMQLQQSGLIEPVEAYVMTRSPTPDEAELVRQLLGLQQRSV